jgi:putative FmdB family regulatory protein
MPTYDYQCSECNHIFDLFQSITSKSTTICIKCKSIATRIISKAPAIVFKGSGFYCTDNKKKKGLKRRFGKDHERPTMVSVNKKIGDKR